MKRGFLKQPKEAKPTTGRSQVVQAIAATAAPYPESRSIESFTQYSNCNNLMFSDDDMKNWAHKVGIPEDELKAQWARQSNSAGNLVYRNIVFHRFEGVTLTNSTILDLLRRKYDAPRPALQNAYKITAAGSGKGMGMFAARDIPAGAIILVENPVIVYPTVVAMPIGLSKEEMFQMLFDRLDPPEQAKVLSLANCKPADICGKAEGIVRTNGICIHLPTPVIPNAPDSMHSATFLDLSRCNHSCGPNAEHTWDQASYSISLHALRAILSGEEITIPYTATTETRETRRQRLMDLYYFQCQCQYCILPDSLTVAASDAARLEMRDWEQKKVPNPLDWCNNLSLPDDHLVKFHKRAIRLHEREGLTDRSYAVHMQMLMIVYGILEDETQFRHWCLKAIERMEVARNQEEIGTLKSYLVDPQVNFPMWGMRKIAKARAHKQ